jgi:hypothetical protein
LARLATAVGIQILARASLLSLAVVSGGCGFMNCMELGCSSRTNIFFHQVTEKTSVPQYEGIIHLFPNQDANAAIIEVAKSLGLTPISSSDPEAPSWQGTSTDGNTFRVYIQYGHGSDGTRQPVSTGVMPTELVLDETSATHEHPNTLSIKFERALENRLDPPGPDRGRFTIWAAFFSLLALLAIFIGAAFGLHAIYTREM